MELKKEMKKSENLEMRLKSVGGRAGGKCQCKIYNSSLSSAFFLAAFMDFNKPKPLFLTASMDASF